MKTLVRKWRSIEDRNPVLARLLRVLSVPGGYSILTFLFIPVFNISGVESKLALFFLTGFLLALCIVVLGIFLLFLNFGFDSIASYILLGNWEKREGGIIDVVEEWLEKR